MIIVEIRVILCPRQPPSSFVRSDDSLTSLFSPELGKEMEDSERGGESALQSRGRAVETPPPDGIPGLQIQTKEETEVRHRGGSAGAQLRPGRGQAGAARGRPLPRLRGAGAAQGGSMFSGEEVQVLWPREPGLLVPTVLAVLPQPRLRERRADAAPQGALEPGPGE